MSITVTTLPAQNIGASSAKLRGEVEIVQVNYLYNEGAGEDDWVAGYSTGSGSQSKESDHFYLDLDSSSHAERAWVTDELVDLSSYNTVKIEWESYDWNYESGMGNVWVYFVTSTDKATPAGDYITVIAKSEEFTSRIDEMDISGLSGSYYIRVHLTGNYVNDAKLKIYKVWLE
jgi:hypothetical protein